MSEEIETRWDDPVMIVSEYRGKLEMRVCNRLVAEAARRLFPSYEIREIDEALR